MDLRRLELLAELSRRGSMRGVAEALGLTTSSVSQGLAVLAREAGTPLLEPVGRQVRLTPAGRRLAAHAVEILAAVERARADLEPDAEPAGTVRVAGFATAVRRSLVPLVGQLAAEHPAVRLEVREQEPEEAFALLDADEVDVALVYDYDLAPLAVPPGLQAVELWSAVWGLAAPAAAARADMSASSAEVVARFAEADWIVNSRGTADEQALRTLAALAGFAPRVVHRADSLDLLQALVAADLGVGLLAADEVLLGGVALLALRDPGVTLRCWAVTRRGREGWAPLRLVLDLLRAG